jgi:hypothetical protein
MKNVNRSKIVSGLDNMCGVSKTYEIIDGLWINVYKQSGWYLSMRLPSGKVSPVSPLEASYKSIPEIDTMDKLHSLADRIRA